VQHECQRRWREATVVQFELLCSHSLVGTKEKHKKLILIYTVAIVVIMIIKIGKVIPGKGEGAPVLN
jgi:hypothetical protein